MLDFYTHKLSAEAELKVQSALVEYVYKQFYVALGGSIFCATVLLIGLYKFENHVILLSWYGLFLLISVLRIGLVKLYLHQKNHIKNMRFWRNLFIFGAFAGGLSWGLAGVFLFEDMTTHASLQALSLTIIAGISAGGIISLSPVPTAGFAFLLPTLLPFIAQIFLQNTFLATLLGIIVTVYLLYLLVTSIRIYHMTRNIFNLQFENDSLVKNLDTMVKSLSIANKKLEHMATHDPLTKIDNRRLFYINVSGAIKRANRNKELMALFYIDLDGFKGVNDKYGHDVGDQVLLVAVERLRSTLRESDIISRMGGDEFTVILEQIHDQHNAEGIAHKVCEALAAPMRINEIEIDCISASIGISLYPLHGIDSETLMKNADTAMYYVKEHGRHNYHLSRSHLKDENAPEA